MPIARSTSPGTMVLNAIAIINIVINAIAVNTIVIYSISISIISPSVISSTDIAGLSCTRYSVLYTILYPLHDFRNSQSLDAGGMPWLR